MIILEKSTNRKFKQDTEWETIHRDWNGDGDVYERTIAFFTALVPIKPDYLNRLELSPWQIGPNEDFIEVKG